MAKQMIPIKEAAGMLAIGRDSLKRLCCAGEVPGAERRPQIGAINSPWWIPAAWVRAEIKRRQNAPPKRGRPYNLAENREKVPISAPTGHLGIGTSSPIKASDIVTIPPAE